MYWLNGFPTRQVINLSRSEMPKPERFAGSEDDDVDGPGDDTSLAASLQDRLRPRGAELPPLCGDEDQYRCGERGQEPELRRADPEAREGEGGREGGKHFGTTIGCSRPALRAPTASATARGPGPDDAELVPDLEEERIRRRGRQIADQTAAERRLEPWPVMSRTGSSSTTSRQCVEARHDRIAPAQEERHEGRRTKGSSGASTSRPAIAPAVSFAPKRGSAAAIPKTTAPTARAGAAGLAGRASSPRRRGARDPGIRGVGRASATIPSRAKAAPPAR